MTRLTTCPDAESVARRAAAQIARGLRRAVAERGVAHLALSGGDTPRRTYELLAAERDALEGVHVWFADERCVPPDDAESNYRLAAETLLAPAAIPAERVHRMRGELGPHEGAAAYAAELRAALGEERGGAQLAGAGPTALPALDLVVLGIGPDGHVASLFPGAPSLDAGARTPDASAQTLAASAQTVAADERAVCLGVEDSPKPPPRRITLSLPVLRAARRCMLLATGASKSDAISAMLGEPSAHVPASLLRRERLTVIVDDAAGPTGPSR